MGVLMRAGRFIQMPIIGLGQGMLPVLGYDYGAMNKARVGELVFKTALAGTTWTLLCWLAIMLFPTVVISLFNAEPEFLRAGEQAVRRRQSAAVSLDIPKPLLYSGTGLVPW